MKKQKEEKQEIKKEGVISSILKIIKESKNPVSLIEIHSKLVKLFPEKQTKSLMSTLKVQIDSKNSPTRMEKEKNVKFEIKQEKEKKTFKII